MEIFQHSHGPKEASRPAPSLCGIGPATETAPATRSKGTVAGQMAQQSKEGGKEVVEGGWQQAGIAAGCPVSGRDARRHRRGAADLAQRRCRGPWDRVGELHRACQTETPVLCLLGQQTGLFPTSQRWKVTGTAGNAKPPSQLLACGLFPVCWAKPVLLRDGRRTRRDPRAFQSSPLP